MPGSSLFFRERPLDPQPTWLIEHFRANLRDPACVTEMGLVRTDPERRTNLLRTIAQYEATPPRACGSSTHWTRQITMMGLGSQNRRSSSCGEREALFASEASNYRLEGGSRVQTKPNCPNFFECPNVSTYISFISWRKASWRDI